MLPLLISLLFGPISPSQFEAEGGLLLREPQTYQLAKGADPGSFHFVRKRVQVEFSMAPDFPVQLVAEDYAGKKITSTTIRNPKPFGFEIDLPPGTYTLFTVAPTKSAHPYWDSDGFQIHINKNGLVHYAQPPEFSRTFLHRRKIEIITPKNFATMSGKRFYIGGWHPPEILDPGNERISLSDVVVRWKPLPGISKYEVELWPLNNPYHPRSSAGESEQYQAEGSTFRFPRDAEDVPGCSGQLNVKDEQDICKGYGHITILMPGAEEEARKFPNISIGGDEWIDSRTAAKYTQACAVADYDGRNVTVEAVGNGPANNAGMRPDETIYSVNGAKIQSLDDLRTALAKAPAGKPISIVVGDDKTKEILTVKG